MLIALCHKKGNIVNEEKVVKWCIKVHCKHLEIQVERRENENPIGKKARKGNYPRLSHRWQGKKTRQVGSFDQR